MIKLLSFSTFLHKSASLNILVLAIHSVINCYSINTPQYICPPIKWNLFHRLRTSIPSGQKNFYFQLHLFLKPSNIRTVTHLLYIYANPVKRRDVLTILVKPYTFFWTSTHIFSFIVSNKTWSTDRGFILIGARTSALGFLLLKKSRLLPNFSELGGDV